MLWTVKDLSQHLKVKPSTLYAWAAKGMLPSVNLNGLIRFDPAEIAVWLQNLREQGRSKPAKACPPRQSRDISTIIACVRAKVHNARGETRPRSSPHGKEEQGGAL
jgi:predicted DNA-binding transcriptional regulator AlpA